MVSRRAALLSLLVLMLITVVSAAPLPSGHSGIAARYPFDVGIASDPAVIFADNFESYTSAAALTNRWNEAYHSANLRIANESINVFHGTKSLEFTVPQTTSEVSNTVARVVSPGQDALFLRYYARFDGGFNVIGSSHNGSTISARYCCPGVRADGFNKFLVSYEAWRDSAATANPGGDRAQDRPLHARSSRLQQQPRCRPAVVRQRRRRDLVHRTNGRAAADGADGTAGRSLSDY